MKALIQRVKEARVEVDGSDIGGIGKGLLIFLGVCKTDTDKEVEYVADKCLGLRIFEDADGKFNISAADADAEVLVVPQFTLYGYTGKGRRPSFDKAAPPDVSRPMYEQFVQHLKDKGVKTETGEFGADMDVHLVNDGPVTFMVEKESNN